MSQQQTHQTYCAHHQKSDDDRLQYPECSLGPLIQWGERCADESSIGPVRFIDSFLHIGKASISRANFGRAKPIARVNDNPAALA